MVVILGELIQWEADGINETSRVANGPARENADQQQQRVLNCNATTVRKDCGTLSFAYVVLLVMMMVSRYIIIEQRISGVKYTPGKIAHS